MYDFNGTDYSNNVDGVCKRNEGRASENNADEHIHIAVQAFISI